jgi:acyl-CoA synthetase (AMP-forming)/AMP-acid ligase II
MADLSTLRVSTTERVAEATKRLNVADRLSNRAVATPAAIAVVCARKFSPTGYTPREGSTGARYATATFAELDADATRIAHGLGAWGVPAGARLALLVPPSIEFVTLVFALLRSGVVAVLIDPGMGRRNLVRCLAEVEPDGFVAVPAVHAARTMMRRKFSRARWNVTIGQRWGWGGLSLAALRTSAARSSPQEWETGRQGNKGNTAVSLSPRLSDALTPCHPDSPAAIIFTSGSTGPAKGVLYTHRMFDTQVAEIQSMYAIEPGGVDLSCFPLFALFNSAMGVTTVLPDMDFSRPAAADPRKLLAAANDWRVTQAFASPAVWRSLAAHCAGTGGRIPTLRQIFSCGAPVPADVLRATLACAAPAAKMHTPYGATECLPVATIEAAEVLAETAATTDQGAGVCVGRKFDSIDWRIIRITDDPVATIDEAEELPARQIGELIVRGPQASPAYVTRTECNAESKIGDNSGEQTELPAPRSPQPTPSWHRLGDVGYRDELGRFWYCGRKSQRVQTADGPLFTECIEAIFNTHSAVRRSALVGVGPRSRQTPVLIFEPTCELQYCGGRPAPRVSFLQLVELLRAHGREHSMTKSIQNFLMRERLPVDVRHNAKINRELLAAWAAKRLPELR